MVKNGVETACELGNINTSKWKVVVAMVILNVDRRLVIQEYHYDVMVAIGHSHMKNSDRPG